MELVIITLVLVVLAVVLLAFNIVFRKKTFPKTHVGQHKWLKDQGVSCANSYDKMERNKLKKELKFKDLGLAQD